MDLSEYLTSDATTLAGLVADRQATAAELLDLARQRRDAVNPAINAIVAPLTGVADARAADPDLSGPFAGNDATEAAAPALFGRLLAQLGNPRTQVGLHVVGPLVLGDDAQHLLERGDLVLGRLRVAEVLLGAVVFRGQVGGHATVLGGASPRTPFDGNSTAPSRAEGSRNLAAPKDSDADPGLRQSSRGAPCRAISKCYRSGDHRAINPVTRDVVDEDAG